MTQPNRALCRPQANEAAADVTRLTGPVFNGYNVGVVMTNSRAAFCCSCTVASWPPRVASRVALNIAARN